MDSLLPLTVRSSKSASKRRSVALSASRKTAKIRVATPIRKIQEAIKPFLEKPLSAKMRTFLDKICPHSGQCVSFGLETDKLRQYFEDYDWSLVDKKSVKKIGSDSNNGFVFEVPFVKDNYKVYTILKSTKNKDADNLFYEALVGLYVNKKNYVFPCFLETYGLYQWPDINFHKRAIRFSEGEVTNTELELDKLVPKKLSYNAFFNDSVFANSTCTNSLFGSVLIQHIHKANTLYDYYKTFRKSRVFFTLRLPQILYQIYAPLAMLSDEFTHYDLHLGNVILYKVGSESQNANGPQQYITMNYHYPNGDVVTFNTDFIAKIIDYGRSYFKENETYNSSNYYQKLTESIKTAPDIEYPEKEKGKYLKKKKMKGEYLKKKMKGEYLKKKMKGECANKSYDVLMDETPPGSFYYISANKRNKSHDLRLAAYIAKHLDNYLSESDDDSENALRTILGCIKYEDINGTKEVAESSYTGLDRLNPMESIRNVEDLHLALKDLIMTTPHFKKMDGAYSKDVKYKKMGEMHVRMDGSRSLQYTVEG
jgi:hypothetical protein